MGLCASHNLRTTLPPAAAVLLLYLLLFFLPFLLTQGCHGAPLSHLTPFLKSPGLYKTNSH